MSELVVLYSTFPDLETVKKISKILIEEKLITCANIFPMGQSMYMWDGELLNEPEVYVYLKTTQELTTKASNLLKSLHPYSVPLILQFTNLTVNQPYLDWVNSQVNISRDQLSFKLPPMDTE